jgi:hypothetical protein
MEPEEILINQPYPTTTELLSAMTSTPGSRWRSYRRDGGAAGQAIEYEKSFTRIEYVLSRYAHLPIYTKSPVVISISLLPSHLKHSIITDKQEVNL